ncbi:hypothetical protein [Limnochorda pilosa]|uniref:Uncharacterized protein n=1 Tax=Limnochorda pilosa TaxID=1555112 RepID=A0A0K2SPB1_LIMPI|nr:hypothetical protein [Limnochorda pilosa]BAS28978.1 hypothetical protein LIP_3151 [Limnochorda pilosa]
MATLARRGARAGLALVVLLWFTACGPPGHADAGATVTQGPLELEADVGLGGVIRPGLPFPLQLHVENRGADVDADLRVLTRRVRLDHPWVQVDELRLPIRLPSGGRFTWNLTLSSEDVVHPVQVEVWPKTGQGAEPLRLEVPLRPLATREPIVALVSRRGLHLPPAEQPAILRDARVVELRRPEVLPHQWDGWLPAQWVVVDDIPLGSLAAPQAEALRLWVLAGGRLLVLPRAASSLPAGWADLLPVTPLGSSLSLEGTTTELGRVPSGATLYLSLPQPGSEELHALAGVPLVARVRMGLGTTGWIGFDLSDPLLDAPLRVALLEAALDGPVRTPPPDPGSGSPLTWRSLRSVPVLPPSPLPLAALLGGYALLAYLTVRLARRRQALLGVALLAALASVVVAGSAPSDPKASAFAAVQVLEASGGWGRGWGAWLLGRADPAPTRLAVNPASWQVGPLDEERRETRTLLTLEADLRGYQWQGPGYLPATVRWPLPLDLHLTAAGGGTWWVENRSRARLEMVLFYDGENLLPLNDLPPGGSLAVDPHDPLLRLARIGIRQSGLAELRRWAVSRLDPGELTAPRTPLVTRALEEGWERLGRQPEPLPVVMALVEPSPLPDGAPPMGPAPVVSLVILRPSAGPRGDGP